MYYKEKIRKEEETNSPGQDTTFPVIVPPSTNVLIDASTSVRVKLIDSNIKKEEVLFCIIMVEILSYGLLMYIFALCFAYLLLLCFVSQLAIWILCFCVMLK